MSIKLTPVNKMLLIEREKQQKQKPDEFGFVLPEKVVLTKHAVVNLVSASESSQYERYVGQKLLVNNSMIEQVEVNNSIFNLISENGVVAIVAESDLFNG